MIIYIIIYNCILYHYIQMNIIMMIIYIYMIIYMRVSINWDIQNGWFTHENSIEMNDLGVGGSPISGNHHIYYSDA